MVCIIISVYHKVRLQLLQVPLGVLQCNDNKLDEMCEIMDKLHEYVPAKQVTESLDAFGDDDPIEMDD